MRLVSLLKDWVGNISVFHTSYDWFLRFYFFLWVVRPPPLEGGRFTWSNSREVEAMSRIDRFLFSADWEEKFSIIKQHRLTRLLPDHFPIMLECGQL
jgi:exonuclease III